MDQARETLELVVGEGDSGPTLRSPGVGRARITLPRRAFVGPGSRVGELLTLGRTADLVVGPRGPRGVIERFAEGLEGGSSPVDYGALLLELGTGVLVDEEDPAEAGAGSADGMFVVAPQPGRVYLRPEPTADPYVAVGAEIQAGAALALVEVMKTFTPLNYSATGGLPAKARVVEVLVEDGAEVESGAPLFRLEAA